MTTVSDVKAFSPSLRLQSPSSDEDLSARDFRKPTHNQNSMKNVDANEIGKSKQATEPSESKAPPPADR
jgi:hypothetical protein